MYYEKRLNLSKKDNKLSDNSNISPPPNKEGERKVTYSIPWLCSFFNYKTEKKYDWST